jgi:Cys-rich repeat protein
MKTTSLTWILMASLIAVVPACKSGNDFRPAHKGEACKTTNDCAAALSCVPSQGAGGGGICVTGEFNVGTTAKECALIQCSTPSDCCPTGSTTCDESRYTCVDSMCKSVQCLSDTSCFGGEKCVNGQCQQCADDSSCAAGESCLAGQCIPPCTLDSECPASNRCTDGKCTDSGCKSDRECIASTSNVEATCGSDGKCVVACQTDLECGNPKEYNFYSCISGKCTYVGCVNDKECELYMTHGISGGKGHAVCRDKVAK